MALANTAKNQNQSIEEEAMKAAAAYELKRTGKSPNVIKKKLGYDLESGELKIEVKGTKLPWKLCQSSYVIITDNERRNATHIYLYCDVLTNPDLHIFEMSKIHKALEPELAYRLQFAQCREDKESEISELAQSQNKSFFAWFDEKSHEIVLKSTVDGSPENTSTQSIKVLDEKQISSFETFLKKYGKDPLKDKLWKISQEAFSILQWISEDISRNQAILSLQDASIDECKKFIQTWNELVS